MSDRILITGAGGGFLGHRLHKFLYDKYTINNTKIVMGLVFHNHTECEAFGPSNSVTRQFTTCNLVNISEVKSLIDYFAPTKVIHLAAKAALRSDNANDIINVNIAGTLNILQSIEAQKYKNPIDFIFASSTMVYGSNDFAFAENDKLRPINIYSISKLACEQLIDIYYRKNIIRPRILRFCGIVGKGMTHGLIYKAINGQEKFTLTGKYPGARIPFISAKTAIQSLDAAISSNRPQVLSNITPKDNISLASMFKTVEDFRERKIELEWIDDGLPNEEVCCYNESMRYQLGIENPPEYTLDELKIGLQEYMDN